MQCFAAVCATTLAAVVLDSAFITGSKTVRFASCKLMSLSHVQQELTRPPPVPAAPVHKEAASTNSNPFSRMLQSMFGTSSSSSGGGKPDPWAPAEAPAAGTNAAGTGNDSSSAAAVSSGVQGGQPGGLVRDSLDGGGQKAALAIRDAPGAGLVMWAESAAGSMELERPYAHSTSLDGGWVV